MKTAIVAVTTLFGLAPAPANAQGDEPAGRFFLTPHLGVTSESDFVEGAVRFSDGDVDFISIEPGTGLLLGLELGYAFGPINYVQLKHAAPMKQKIPECWPWPNDAKPPAFHLGLAANLKLPSRDRSGKL